MDGEKLVDKGRVHNHPGGLRHPRGGIPGGTLVVRTAEKMAPKERRTQKRSRKKSEKKKSEESKDWDGRTPRTIVPTT